MDVQIEKPRLGVPVSLIVDDPAPCINPLYYFRLQVDRANYDFHEQDIPLDLLEQFVAVCRARGIRGKFSVLPYPAGLGSILDGWEGCDRREIDRWLAIVREEVAPAFDITPEILTHTLALDLGTRALLPRSEHDWLAERSRDEIADYFVAAVEILRAAGLRPTGITQPCYFNGLRADYARATLDVMRRTGGPEVTYYFIDGYFEGPPVPAPEVVLLEREAGAAVVAIMAFCDDHFWFTQRTASRRAEEVADLFLTDDGRGGRLAELSDAGAWLIWVCHWQSLYSDGSREGLRALDLVAERLHRRHGPRLLWLTLSEIARYRAASEACAIGAREVEGGWEIELDAAIGCADWTLSFDAPGIAAGRVERVTWQGAGDGFRSLTESTDDEPLLGPNTWRLEGGRVVICFELQRGRQVVRVRMKYARSV